jgi:DNA primase
VGRQARCFNAAGHKGGRDDNPSLAFFPDKGRFKCFACSVGGDAIDLVRSVLSFSFREAVAWLTDLAGGQPPEAHPGGSARNDELLRRLEAATEIYKILFDQALPPNPDSPAGQYLLSRGLDPAKAADCGARELLDPADFGKELLFNYGDEYLQAAGLISRRDHFLFQQHPLLFFYLDGKDPVFLQARDITGQARAKELRPAGLPCPVPFNVNILGTPQECVYVCEGCIDTLSAGLLGLPAVGVPGVQSFRDDWFYRFRSASRVVILFDNDEAGHTQAYELRSRFRQKGFTAEAWFPATGNDVNDLLVALSQGENAQ